MKPIDIIDEYYKEGEALRLILLTHSQCVRDRALECAARHPELGLDTQFVSEAAMLHDIGIFRCNAPSIECHGTEPYICHGIIGANLLRERGMERHARVCERHTGAGLSLASIESRQLPLPHRDFMPETLEEQLICYADKFYSKSHLDHEKSYDEALRSLLKFGPDGAARFAHWHSIFG